MPKAFSFRKGTICVKFQKNPVAGDSLDKTRVPRFSVKNYLSHNAEFFRKGTLLCCVSEKFRQRKRSWTRKRAIKIFRRKFFCLTVPKKSVGQHFFAVFEETSGSEELYG